MAQPTVTVKVAAAASTTNGESWATASWTPTTGKVYYLFSSVVENSDAQVGDMSVSGNGLTWTRERAEQWNQDATFLTDRLSVFRADAAGGGSTGVTTISTSDGFAHDGASWCILEVTDDGGVVQVGGNHSSGAAAQVDLGSIASNSLVLGGVAKAGTEVIAPTGDDTELGEAGHSSPNRRFQVQWGSTATSDWSWSGSRQWGAVSVEIGEVASGTTFERQVAASAASLATVAATFWSIFSRTVAASAATSTAVSTIRALIRTVAASASASATASSLKEALRAVSASAVSAVSVSANVLAPAVERAVSATAAAVATVTSFNRDLVRQAASSATSAVATNRLLIRVRTVAASAATATAVSAGRVVDRIVQATAATAAAAQGTVLRILERAVAATAVTGAAVSNVTEFFKSVVVNITTLVSTTATVVSDRLDELPKIRKLTRRNR